MIIQIKIDFVRTKQIIYPKRIKILTMVVDR